MQALDVTKSLKHGSGIDETHWTGREEHAAHGRCQPCLSPRLLRWIPLPQGPLLAGLGLSAMLKQP